MAWGVEGPTDRRGPSIGARRRRAAWLGAGLGLAAGLFVTSSLVVRGGAYIAYLVLDPLGLILLLVPLVVGPILGVALAQVLRIPGPPPVVTGMIVLAALALAVRAPVALRNRRAQVASQEIPIYPGAEVHRGYHLEVTEDAPPFVTVEEHTSAETPAEVLQFFERELQAHGWTRVGASCRSTECFRKSGRSLELTVSHSDAAGTNGTDAALTCYSGDIFPP